MSRRPRASVALVAALAGLALAGCSSAGANEVGASSSTPASVATSRTPPAPTLGGDLTVFAAASLTDTFTTIGAQMMAANPDLTITFNFGSSGTLAEQLLSGAPADVFASASTTTMATAAEVVGEPALFAHNSLVIVVPKGNPGGVTGLSDFAEPDLTIALCDPSAPCGAAARTVFANAGITPAPDTLGQDVRATSSYVTSGEVDAALVYTTDAIAAGSAVETITFPEAAEVVNDYPIAVVEGTRNADAARAFVEHVLSPAGQAVLTDAGFDPT